MPTLSLLVCDHCFVIRIEHEERKCPICEPGILRITKTKYDISTLAVNLLQDTYKQIRQGGTEAVLMWENKYGFRDFEVGSARSKLSKFLLLRMPLNRSFEPAIETIVAEMLSLLFAKRRQILREAAAAIRNDDIDTVIRFMESKRSVQNMRPWADEFLQNFIDGYNLAVKNYLVCCNNCSHLHRYAGQPACVYCGSVNINDFGKQIRIINDPEPEEILSLLFFYAEKKGYEGLEKLLYAFLISYYPQYSKRVPYLLHILTDSVALFRKGLSSLPDLFHTVHDIQYTIDEDIKRAEKIEMTWLEDALPPPPPAKPKLRMHEPSTKIPYNNTSVRSDVFSSVFAPNSVKLTDSFPVQVYIYDKQDIDAVEKMAKSADEDTAMRMELPLFRNVKKRQKLEVALLAPGLSVDEPVQTCVWTGQITPVQFIVCAPPEFAKTEVICSVILSADSLPIGHMKCKVKFVAATVDMPQSSPNLSHLCKYKRVFTSYASQDRTEVLKRVQMLQAYGVDYFQDILSLEPGDEWEKKIYGSISICDAFFLFWSSAASRSEWVYKEVIYALAAKKGKDDNAPYIIPIIIEGPPVPKPPKELNFLHFNDQLLYLMER